MIRRPPRSTQSRSSAASDVYKRQLKKYGMMVADNGADWYVGGAPDPRWDDEALSVIREVKGSDFEVVDSRFLAPKAFTVSLPDTAVVREGDVWTTGGSFVDES